MQHIEVFMLIEDIDIMCWYNGNTIIEVRVQKKKNASTGVSAVIHESVQNIQMLKYAKHAHTHTHTSVTYEDINFLNTYSNLHA